MGKDEEASKQKKSGVWWPCAACGGWAWADRKSCPSCKAPCPRWCQAYQGAGKSNRLSNDGSRGADGKAPTAIVVGDFVVPGQGKKAQKKARQLLNALADAKSYRELHAQGPASKPTDPLQCSAEEGGAHDADMATSNDPSVVAGADLERRLAEAEAALAKWQAIPPSSRMLVQGYDQHLAAAVDAKEALLREKRAAKPWLWRLKGAQRIAAKAERAKSKISGEVDELLAQQMDLEERLSRKRSELEAARVAHEEAVASLAAVRAEAAEDASAEAPASQGPLISAAAADIVQGLVNQLGEMPKAAAAGNLEAALRAALQQVEALLPRAAQDKAVEVAQVEAPLAEGSAVGHRPPGTAAVVSGLVAEGGALEVGQPPGPAGHRPPGTEEIAASLSAEARSLRMRPY